MQFQIFGGHFAIFLQSFCQGSICNVIYIEGCFTILDFHLHLSLLLIKNKIKKGNIIEKEKKRKKRKTKPKKEKRSGKTLRSSFQLVLLCIFMSSSRGREEVWTRLPPPGVCFISGIWTIFFMMLMIIEGNEIIPYHKLFYPLPTFRKL